MAHVLHAQSLISEVEKSDPDKLYFMSAILCSEGLVADGIRVAHPSIEKERKY